MLFENEERNTCGNVIFLQRLVYAENIRLLQIGKMQWKVAYTDGVTVYAYVDISVTEEVKNRFVTVKGTLKYSDGTPVANKKLVLYSEAKTVYTDENGNYEFLSVETGEHILNIYSDNDSEMAVCRINVSSMAESDSIDVSKKENCEVINSISGDEFIVNVLVAIDKPEESKPEESKPEESMGESQPEDGSQQEPSNEETTETDPDGTAPSTGDENTALMLIMLMAGISGIILLLCGISYASEEKEKKH